MEYKNTILVTGANGQLGQCFKDLENNYPEFKFIFTTKEDLPIENIDSVNKFFEETKFNYCINCAAYTAVDKAEAEKEIAFLVNAKAVHNLAALCKKYSVKFFHFSTDYVFDGDGKYPYLPNSTTSPVNYYGFTKLEGENLALAANPDSIIIRTSWVYSQYGKNFVKTMLALMQNKPEISVVNDQIGSPTNANDLAKAVMQIITGTWHSGIYHYSNKGVISWYDFANEIKNFANLSCKINAIPTKEFPTPAKRPAYSVLNTESFEKCFNIKIPDWKSSLHAVMAKLI